MSTRCLVAPPGVVGKRVQERLACLRRTQVWLADRLGKTTSQISLLVNGRVGPGVLTVAYVARVADVLGVSISDLVKPPAAINAAPQPHRGCTRRSAARKGSKRALA